MNKSIAASNGMDKVYNHKDVEEKIYKNWEESGYFQPEINPQGKHYSIILPPPNANAPLHFGHAMYVAEDILIRYHRMQGEQALWLPGADHAGFETQFVFEKKLKLEGKSRFDYDRQTLYKMILDYVEKNRGGMEGQLKKLGFSLDWKRKKFTLDEDIVKIVHKTFKKLYDDGLLYRGERLVNYCTRCGTSFSDLEVNHKEQKDQLFYVKYPLKKGGSITVATTRPETLFGDVAVMVNPNDGRYRKLIGEKAMLPLTKKEIPIIGDSVVDMKFGTGAVKVTPAHDFNDYEVGKKNNLSLVQVVGLDGKMRDTKIADGLYVKQARKLVMQELQKQNLIENINENYIHVIGVCYKCSTVIEPMLLPQWFIKMESLAKPAIEVVKKSRIKIYPKRFEKVYLDFLENIRDWNISRQTVWGIRIPAWKNKKTGEWKITEGKAPEGTEWEQDQDTFDTWFSSSQWPFVTLMSNSSSKFKVQSSKSDFNKFYPTSVMETGYDILRWWVARMVMMGIYATGKIPFENIVLHGLVNDPLGKKMSKSKGNVVNPMELVDQYGADAVRFALIYGNATGNDQALSYSKLDASRKFTNKLWNMGRFIDMNRVQGSKFKVQSLNELSESARHENDREMIRKVGELVKKVTDDLEKYNFNYAAEALYEFTWHEFADKYIEEFKTQNSKLKTPDQSSFIILNSLFLILLKLLHPFMPFVTEEIYKRFKFGKSIMIDKWPACHAS